MGGSGKGARGRRPPQPDVGTQRRGLQPHALPLVVSRHVPVRPDLGLDPLDRAVEIRGETALTLTFPITVTRGTAEPADLGTLPTRIRIGPGQLRGTVNVATRTDSGTDDETLTAALDTANLPSGIAAGSVTSVEVTIVDMTSTVGNAMVDLWASPRDGVKAGESVTITARVSHALENDVTIPLTLKPDDGTTSADYGTISNITITAGATSGTATIATVADTDKYHQSFRVLLGDLPAGLSRGYWWVRITMGLIPNG